MFINIPAFEYAADIQRTEYAADIQRTALGETGLEFLSNYEGNTIVVTLFSFDYEPNGSPLWFIITLCFVVKRKTVTTVVFF